MKFCKSLLLLLKLGAVIASNNTKLGNDELEKQCTVDGTCESKTLPETTEVGIDANGDITTTIATTTTTTTTESKSGNRVIASVPFPKMPPKIDAILHENWDDLDSKGAEMIHTMSLIDGAVEFAHARSTFFEHLKGTFGILSAWGQPEEVKRTGLVHTAYSGDLFMFFLFDSNSEDDRSALRSILGEKAEALTYLFGTVNRGPLCHFKDVVNKVRPDSVCSKNETHTVHHRGSDSGMWGVDNKSAANILMVTIADYLDQMVETNGWKDHHQIENGGSHLYPGNGMPALGFYWFTSICYGIKDHLDVVPSIFNHCETVISYEEEKEARDSYWKGVSEEEQLSEEEQVVLFNTTVSLNPFVGEPHMMLSQIYYRQGKYLDAATEARSALQKFYTLASCWDKRRSFAHWVGFSRVLMLRANRMLEGQNRSFPCKDPDDPNYVNYNNLELTNLRDMVLEMRAREEE